MSARIVELASGPPSRDRWAQLFEAMDEWPRNREESDRLLAQVRDRLAGWPTVLRAAVPTESEQPEFAAWMWGLAPGITGAPWVSLVRHLLASVEELRAVPESSDSGRSCLPAITSLQVRERLASLTDLARVVPRLPALRSLDLSLAVFYPRERPPGEWSQLIDALSVSEVRELDCSRAPIAPEDLRRLVLSPLARQLEVLRLSAARPPIGIEGARALARWPRPSRLRALASAENGLGDEGALVLSTSGCLDSVESLDLSRNGVTGPFLESHLERAGATAMTELRLSGSRLSVRALAALGTGDGLSEQCSLDVSDCGLGDSHLSALLGHGFVGRVAELDLRANALTDESVDRIATAGFSTLRALRVEKNRLSHQGAGRLEAWCLERGVSCTARPLR